MKHIKVRMPNICSATIEQPSDLATKRRLNEAERLARNAPVF